MWVQEDWYMLNFIRCVVGAFVSASVARILYNSVTFDSSFVFGTHLYTITIVYTTVIVCFTISLLLHPEITMFQRRIIIIFR